MEKPTRNSNINVLRPTMKRPMDTMSTPSGEKACFYVFNAECASKLATSSEINTCQGNGLNN